MDQILTFVVDHWPLCLAMVTLLAVASSFSEQTVDAISPDVLVQQINNDEKLVLVDLRTQKSYEQSHIRGTKSVPFSDQITLDGIASDTAIVLICQTGRVAEQARKKLCKIFPNLSILQGGINAWIQDGLPTISGVPS